MSRRSPRLKFPENVAPLVADIAASRTLTRGQLAQAAELLKLDVAMTLASDASDKRRELTPRQAATKPVTRAEMNAFCVAAVPEGEATMSVSGVPPHVVTLRHTDRIAYSEGREEPDWYDESAEHPSCDHAAWLLAILALKFGMPNKER